MAEAIFAGKKIKKFSYGKRFTLLAFSYAIFPWFFKNFFMGYCPGNTGNRKSQQKKPRRLSGEVHLTEFF